MTQVYTETVTIPKIIQDIASSRQKIRDYYHLLDNVKQEDRIGNVSDAEIVEIIKEESRIFMYILIAHEYATLNKGNFEVNVEV
jgi:hypothetical protein